MTLPAELRAEADSWPTVYESDRRVIALLHRAADALEAGTIACDVTGKYGYLGRNVRITLLEENDV